MTRRLVILILGACLMGLFDFSHAGPRDAQWKKVDEAIQKGLPKTAIELLEPIIANAKKDKAYAEAIKAVGKKLALEGNIQGNKPEEKITRLEAEIARSPEEMQPMMKAILANWYWQYFQANRWRYVQRTATAQPPGNDILTWDLPRILAEVDKRFADALAHEAELKKTPIRAYDDLLVKGTMPDAYRPTVFDFVAFEALAFYTAGEQAGARAEDAFELMADSPIFGSVDEFIKWQPKTTDKASLTLRAIHLYQNLLKFHKDDKDQSAFLDANLARLQFGYNRAVNAPGAKEVANEAVPFALQGEEGVEDEHGQPAADAKSVKQKRYKAALKQFVDKWADHETSAHARALWAGVVMQEGNRVEARKIAQQGVDTFPKSVGGIMCFNLVQSIEAKEINVTTERVWNAPWPTIQVHYRNITQAHFRIYRDSWTARMKRPYDPEYLDEKERRQLLARKPEREWKADLPATKDYKSRTHEVDVPKDLKPGFYYLVASADPKFSANENIVSYTSVWVSKLALVMRSSYRDGFVEGFVLDANSGEPIPAADIQIWARVDRRRAVNDWEIRAAKTDQNGLFRVENVGRFGFRVLAQAKGDALATAGEYHAFGRQPREVVHEQTVFFTDRSLYRPGQTISYKGICLVFNQERDNYKTIPNRGLSVIFSDPNGKEIARQQVRTNDYGSFSGSFVAPRDRLMGRMMIHTDGRAHGTTTVQVEEYKRPKFQTTLEAPKVAPKLNGKVTISGKATAYTGAAINGAQVRWRVVRQVRYPDWWFCCYWWRQPRTAAQEIAHGTTTTEADGTFKVEFIARPDLSVPEQDEPTFRFSITADVTDTTGETRSGDRTINVGYAALKASMTAEDWQTVDKPVEVTITTQTLDNEPQAAEGVVKVYHLKQPDKVIRANLEGGFQRFGRRGRFNPGMPPQGKPDPSNPNSWELGEKVAEEKFKTDKDGKVKKSFQLAPGPFRAVLESKDRFGKPIKALLPIQVLQPGAKVFPVKVANVVAAPKWTLEPGEEFKALWGTGYDKARAFVEIEHRGKILKAFWTELGATQQTVQQTVTEAQRGGFTLRVTMVRENRAYLTNHHVNVPWTNKELTIKWEHFTSKLEPAKKETWTAVISGKDAKKAVAEMVATLYDESLDAYLPHHWMQRFSMFRQDHSYINIQFENSMKYLQHLQGGWRQDYKPVNITYRSFPHEIAANLWGYAYFGQGGRRMKGMAPGGGMMLERNMAADGMAFGGMPPAATAPSAPPMAAREKDKGESSRALAKQVDSELRDEDESKKPREPGAGHAAPKGPDLGQIAARKNLNETAFFFPHLISDKDGKVKLEFTMPEALTQWKFMGFAHDSDLRSGFLQDKAVTAKELMVQPNPPRFLREGDVLEFTVKVSNQSDKRQPGTVRLTLADGHTGKSVDELFSNVKLDQTFDLAEKESKSFSWRLSVPDGVGPISYKAVGAGSKVSDGEEGYLPILARRILVTESLPLPIRGAQTKKFTFEKLAKSRESNTLQHQSLTVQMVSNPSWYAVMALPYLMEYPYECSEQVFNRLYANSLARHIASSDPRIEAVFKQWQGTPALDSPLEKNQDLKAVMLEETPWLRQAKKESEARRNVGILFDKNRLDAETARAMAKLADLQNADGAWSWFPGGPSNDYITLYITTGFGRMRHLGVKVEMNMALKSLARLDNWIDQQYRELKRKGLLDKNNLSSTAALYLYGRSFFLKDMPIAKQHKEAVDYFLKQAQKHWLALGHRQSQGHLALALNRFGDKQTPVAIMKSIKERSVSNEEMGMFWRDLELSYFWFRAPIETQAVMIEAFDEIMNDSKAVEDCKVWMLKQKQTQDWKTTKATADAIYALLLRGDNLLASTELVEMVIGGQTIKPEKVEAGTGFYEQRFVKSEVTPRQGEITLKKTEPGVAWGSVHWQYLEDMGKITPHEGTPLKLTKSLYTKVHTKKGPVLEPVKSTVNVGDELVVRIVLRTDRDMEYVHMKDYRGSGTEPVNVLSRYRYQDGLGYYESTRDTASHFFIDYLPKGTYVFEYSTRVVHKGTYQTGIANIQCMYAPEFNSHSESLTLLVQ